jgi:hypothetical protein
MWVRDFVVLVVLLAEVLQDAARFEKANLLAIGEGVGYGWDAAVGIDFEEPGLSLRIFAYIDMLDFGRGISISDISVKQGQRIPTQALQAKWIF